MPTFTIRELLKRATDYLQEKGIESPRLTAEILLAHQLKVDRVALYLNFDQPLTPAEISGFRSLVKRRLRHEPIQYITGVQEFWSLDFAVGSGVLVPRPESEVLIEQASGLVKASKIADTSSLRVLEIGTGSGALAVSLAKELPDARIWATDISPKALQVAHSNAETHHVAERITFVQGDLWEALGGWKDVSFDVILSNPPYVSLEEYPDLPPEVRDFEPRMALDGGEGGMFHIERIIDRAPDFMKEGAWLLLEMSPHQTERALRLLELRGVYCECSRVKDYSRRYRVVMGSKKTS